jgi:phosphatidylinositol alpha-1,6-mannosyltransferase
MIMAAKNNRGTKDRGTKDRGMVLLIANNAPPVRGGSSVVYAGLAGHARDRIIVIAPKFSYMDRLPITGWRGHDRSVPYQVVRLKLLRTPIGGPSGRGLASRLRFKALDLAISLRLALTVIKLLLTKPIRAVCIGELVPSGWILAMLRFWPNIRRVVYLHGEEITMRDAYDPDARRRRRALTRAQIAIAVSRFTADAVRALIGDVASPRIVLIGNGVDTARFTPRPRPADLMARYGLDGKFVFIAVCRLLEKKGVDNAIRAFAGLHRTQPACRYLIIGTGPFAGRLAAIVAECGVTDSVIFAGDVPDEDLADHYSLGDVFLMPNRALPDGDTEGFGLVFLEANAAGLPAIAGRDGGSTDAVQDGVNGLVVDGNSVTEIGIAMRRLFESSALREKLAQHGLERASSMDWSRRSAAFLEACLGDAA